MTIPKIEENQAAISKLEWILAPIIALFAGLWVFFHIGTAVNWDDLLYMNLSQYTTPQTWILNRYGHIYLQKFFFFLANDSILGGRIFWCFIFSSTCVLTYWSAKLIAGRKGYIIGCIAVLLFIMQPIFAKELGCTLADFTAMILITAGVLLYLILIDKKRKNNHWILVALGLLFFLAVKSKETGICMAFLFLGLGKDANETFQIKQFVKEIGWVLVGIAVGSLILMTLDLVFMSDFFFSIRPSNIKGLLSCNFFIPYEGDDRLRRPIMSWFTYFTSSPLFGVLLLYILVGCNNFGKKISSHQKVVWLLPLATILFLTFIRQHFFVTPRYFAPAIPVLCIWAAQFFVFDVKEKNKWNIPNELIGVSLAALAFVIVFIFTMNMARMAKYYTLENTDIFYNVAVLPTLIIALLAITVLSKKRGLIFLFVSYLCLFSLAYYPMQQNLTLLKQRKVAQRSEWRYAPFKAFENDLKFDKNNIILISKDIHKRSWMLGRRQDSQCWMFNIYFNQKYDQEQFIDGSMDDILKANYDYGLLTWQDWQEIKKNNQLETLLKNYEPKYDKQTQTILLTSR